MRATLRQWLEQEPFAIGLSSGFFGFFAHTGFYSELSRQGLDEPVQLAGSSAGALVASAWASGVRSDDLAVTLSTLERGDFWDPWPGLGLLAGKRFARKLDDLLPAKRFEQCTTRLAVSTHDVLARKARVLESGPLPTAVRASCAVPFLFHPVWIDGRPFVDGGVSDRPGLRGIRRGQRLFFHHLASRSAWRKKKSPAMTIPRRQNMVTLVIEGLPRSGPFRLDAGREAMKLAREATARALDEPIVDGVVRVRV